MAYYSLFHDPLDRPYGEGPAVVRGSWAWSLPRGEEAFLGLIPAFLGGKPLPNVSHSASREALVRGGRHASLQGPWGFTWSGACPPGSRRASPVLGAVGGIAKPYRPSISSDKR